MSNALAIATVTEVLRQTLAQPADSAVPGATVSAVRPSAGASGLTQKGVNLFLYQVSPNVAWRNADLPTRGSDGRLVQRPQVALDLHYLLSFYGDETSHETQRLLGAIARELHAKPVLARQTVRDVIAALVAADAAHYLKDSDLSEQLELVKFTPLSLSLEELSKLWSVFFQTPYALTVAYQGTVVLIEADEHPRPALPVTERTLVVTALRRPEVESMTPPNPGAGETIVLRGRNLKGQVTRVAFGDLLAAPAPDAVQAGEIRIALPTALQAGLTTARVVHEVDFDTPGDPHAGAQSNAVAFALRPRIAAASATPGSAANSVDVALTVDPTVGANQDVTLMLNSQIGSEAHRIRVPARTAPTTHLTATVPNLASGQYFVRVVVDGADSQLDLDPASASFGPTVTIP